MLLFKFQSYLLRWIPLVFAMIAILFLTGGYVLSKDGFFQDKIVAPIPIGNLDTKQNKDKIKIEVLKVKTTDKYPPNRFFPKDWQPKYKELTGGDCFASSGDLIRKESKVLYPCITAKAYLIYDKTSGQILYAKNHTQELAIASLTKIMTAIVVLDYVSKESNNIDFNTRLVVQEKFLVGESHMGLSPLESVRIEDLLYGLMLPSGNDAAETLAYGVANAERDKFINMMNKKAQELGMFDTYFVNPTGLDGKTRDHTSFSTALDLLALTNYALENKKFKEIVGTKEWIVSYKKGKHKAFFLYNKLALAQAHPAISGVKPGTTDFAGNCLVSYAQMARPLASPSGKQEYIIIMLDAPKVKDETVNIYKMLYGE